MKDKVRMVIKPDFGHEVILYFEEREAKALSVQLYHLSDGENVPE